MNVLDCCVYFFASGLDGVAMCNDGHGASANGEDVVFFLDGCRVINVFLVICGDEVFYFF